jgi:hypothetical protein
MKRFGNYKIAGSIILLLAFTALVAGIGFAQEKTLEEKIQSALSAGPEVLREGARIVDWPGSVAPKVPGVEAIELRPGTNGWTCLPDDVETAGNDPMCLNEIYWQTLQARLNQVDPPTIGIGIGYMLQEGVPAGSPPHMMVFVPGSDDGYAAFSTQPGPLPWIMFPDTPYAHLMVTMVKANP